MRIALLILTLFLVGCSTAKRPVLLCPPACKSSVGDWTTFRECLFRQDGRYWLTDSAGRPLESYRVKHDHGVFESSVMSRTTTREDPDQIGTQIILSRDTKGAVLHLIRSGQEEMIPLGCAALEQHGEFDVLYLK